MQETGFDPWISKIPWRREWQLTPVFLPGEFHGQMSLSGYNPRGHRVRHDWVTNTHTHTHTHTTFHFLPSISPVTSCLNCFRGLSSCPPVGRGNHQVAMRCGSDYFLNRLSASALLLITELSQLFFQNPWCPQFHKGLLRQPFSSLWYVSFLSHFTWANCSTC